MYSNTDTIEQVLPQTVDWRELTPTRKAMILSRPEFSNSEGVQKTVKEILDDVRREGDKALRHYSQKFDFCNLEDFLVTKNESEIASRKLSVQAKQAIERAKLQIEKFQTFCAPEDRAIVISPGIQLLKQSRPIDSVGLYIPGGSAPLPSTVLMLALPAKIANCPEIVICTPPNAKGEIDPSILYAAQISGTTKIFKIGGAQAIAALAFGTESVPKVNKVFGPGNAYVTAAKMMVTKYCNGLDIDMPAGPSEVIVVCDSSADYEFVASDLLSQAEHDPNSQVILIADCSDTIACIKKEILVQLDFAARSSTIKSALASSRFIKVSNIEEAIDISNEYAPEHLILNVENYNSYIPKIRNAGSVFLGPYSPESAGDYASGTNHVLPTYGYAKSMSGISVDSFLKQLTFQTISIEGLRDIGPTIETLAGIEGLEAHKYAVTCRLDKAGRS